VAHFFERFARRAAVVAVVGMAIILAAPALAQAPNPNLLPYPTPPPNNRDVVKLNMLNNLTYQQKCRTQEVGEEIKNLQYQVSILNSQIPEIKSQITDLLMKGSSNAKAVAAAPPPPPPPAEIPQARQFASLAPVEAEAAAAHRFTLRYDETDTVLTPSSVRALHDALDAIEAGQDVRIAIAGCEANTDFADGSPCARHVLRLKHLLGRYGVENPDRLLVQG
jgi:hypothetical protein